MKKLYEIFPKHFTYQCVPIWCKNSSFCSYCLAEISEIPMCCEICLTLSYAGHPWSLRLVFTPRQPWMPPDILMLTNDGFMEAFSIAFLQERVNDLSEQNVINGVYIATPLIQVTAFVVRKLSHSIVASSSIVFFQLGSLRKWPEGRKESVSALVSELYLLYKEYNVSIVSLLFTHYIILLIIFHCLLLESFVSFIFYKR